MKIKELENLITSVYDNDIKSIRIEKNQSKVTINKNNLKTKNKKLIKIKKEDRVTQTNTKAEIQEENQLEHSHTYSTIVSPMVGTFYQSPAPNEPSFIEIGEVVKPKQTVCIIEAMKLMNEIESEVSGEIVEILVKNGDIVDCGQALIKIKAK